MTPRTKKKIAKRVQQIAENRAFVTPLTHKDKLDIVRDLIIKNPSFNRFGFNRVAMKAIKEIHHVEITDFDMSMLKKEVLDKWAEDKEVSYTKNRLIDMLNSNYEKALKVETRLKCIEIIAKIEGLSVEQIRDITPRREFDFSRLSDMEVLSLEQMRSKLIGSPEIKVINPGEKDDKPEPDK